MAEEIEVLKTIAQRLDEAGIAYMLTGSLACHFYAVPRMTRDIDIVIELKATDIKRISNLFQDQFFVDSEMIAGAVKNRGMFNIIHNELVLKIDFIMRKASEYRLTEFQRRRKMMLEGVPLWVVTPEDLIISKLEWAKESLSEMQFKDVKNILDGVAELDHTYLAKWIEALGLSALYERVKR